MVLCWREAWSWFFTLLLPFGFVSNFLVSFYWTDKIIKEITKSFSISGAKNTYNHDISTHYRIMCDLITKMNGPRFMSFHNKFPYNCGNRNICTDFLWMVIHTTQLMSLCTRPGNMELGNLHRWSLKIYSAMPLLHGFLPNPQYRDPYLAHEGRIWGFFCEGKHWFMLPQSLQCCVHSLRPSDAYMSL